MRDKVGSPLFRLGKRVEHAVERWAPDHFESLYELVSFTTVPYAEARRPGRCNGGSRPTSPRRAAAGRRLARSSQRR